MKIFQIETNRENENEVEKSFVQEICKYGGHFYFLIAWLIDSSKMLPLLHMEAIFFYKSHFLFSS